MNRKISLSVAVALISAAPALALACSGHEKLIFSCTTTKEKHVEVCDAGKSIRYSFGKKGAKPEMALSVPRAAATTYQWNGIGRYASYIVSVPNGKTVYNVFSGVDRLTDEHTIIAGINVETNSQHIATIQCKPSTVQSHIEGIDLREAE